MNAGRADVGGRRVRVVRRLLVLLVVVLVRVVGGWQRGLHI